MVLYPFFVQNYGRKFQKAKKIKKYYLLGYNKLQLSHELNWVSDDIKLIKLILIQ